MFTTPAEHSLRIHISLLVGPFCDMEAQKRGTSADTGCTECAAADDGGAQQGDALHLHLQLRLAHHRAARLQMRQVPLPAAARGHHVSAHLPHLLRWVTHTLNYPSLGICWHWHVHACIMRGAAEEGSCKVVSRHCFVRRTTDV